MKRVLITGGAGFVGSHFCEHLLKNTDAHIVILDKLTYASNGFDRLRDIEAYRDDRVTVLSADFSNPLSEGIKQEIGNVDYIFHLGAESHVDNSITNPEPFVISNVLGTMNMLNFARELKEKGVLKCFFLFSTDEVFGPAPEGVEFKENDRHNPTNPYSATKSGSEMLAKAYRNTYKLPIIISRSTNIIGERQHPEKYVVKVINKILSKDILTIHSNADKTKAGSRFYIHARNVADGYLHLIKIIESETKDDSYTSPIGQDFHITGEIELDNLELASMIADIIGKKLYYEMTDFHSSRPGHDLRYALDGSKMKGWGWEPPKTIDESLRKTVEWFIAPEHKKWLDYEYKS